jgi:pyruvate kinase
MHDGLPIVGCTLFEALDNLAPGERVFIDDGKIGTDVIKVTPEGAVLDIVQAPAKGCKIRSDKGLNFPDTDFTVMPLTDKDRDDLDFVAQHADMVGYSFVQQPSDVDLLLDELRQRLPINRSSPALVLKIETRQAVKNLPGLIVHAAGKLPSAVMIARGDLAIELGFQRMAEMQEEILWLCEAAHVPVIWATQVLETLTKEGLPTRAEVTDAAMANRAECVMLNKGPNIIESVLLLNDVLTRMAGHQQKKTSQLRALRAWEAVFARDELEPGTAN